MRHRLVRITEWYLLEIILAIMRILGFFLLLFFLGRDGVYRILGGLSAFFIGSTTAVKITHGEGCLVTATPIIFELACSPAALEFGLTGIARGRVVEVPTVVSVKRVTLRR